MNKREIRSIKLCCAAQCKAWELETLLVHSHKVLLFGEREREKIFQLTKAFEVFSSHELLLSKKRKKEKNILMQNLWNHKVTLHSAGSTNLRLQKGDFDINYFHLRNCIIIYEHTAAIWLLDDAFGLLFFFRMGIITFIHFLCCSNGNKK